MFDFMNKVLTKQWSEPKQNSPNWYTVFKSFKSLKNVKIPSFMLCKSQDLKARRATMKFMSSYGTQAIIAYLLMEDHCCQIDCQLTRLDLFIFCFSSRRKILPIKCGDLRQANKKHLKIYPRPPRSGNQ